MSVRVPKDSLRENLVMAADEIIRLRGELAAWKAAFFMPAHSLLELDRYIHEARPSLVRRVWAAFADGVKQPFRDAAWMAGEMGRFLRSLWRWFT